MKLTAYISLLLLLTLFPKTDQAQEQLIDEKTLALIDTLFIDNDIKNWSFRLFSNYKDQRVKIKNESSEYQLFPSDPYGIGFGIANKKMILDIGFNIKSKDRPSSSKFNLAGDLILDHHLIGFNFHYHQGLFVENETFNYKSFREDIHSFSSIISYMYMFNAQKYSAIAVKTGLARQKKSALSLGLGAIALYTHYKGDSSFVAQEFSESFNEFAYIKESKSAGLGINLGMSAFIALPDDFFISINAETGLGLTHKSIENPFGEYKPSDPMMYQFRITSAVGYNGKNIYLNLSMTHINLHSDLDMGNRGVFNNTNAKLVLGYKLGSVE